MTTQHQLIAGAVLLFGIGLALFGLVEIFAGGMSDAPAEGARVSRQGCLVGLLGLGAVLLALWLRH